MRLASLRNSSGYHDFILCARVNATKWVVHPGTYRRSGRRVYHFSDLEVLDVVEHAWKPGAQKKRRIPGAVDPECYQLPADLGVYNSKSGEHHGLLSTLAVAQLMAFQAEGSDLTQAQGLSRMNFQIGTWPAHAHRHMLLLVYRHCSGELRTRNMKRLQEACLALTKPPSGALPPKRSFARKTYSEDHVRTLAIRAAEAAPDHIRCRRRLGPTAQLPGDISCRPLRTKAARRENAQE